MLVHSVFFWLKDDLTPEQITAFQAGLETLKKIPTAEAVYVGEPAATAARPVVDASYSFGLTVAVASVADHDAYQIDPLHKAFVEEFSTYWTKVLIYDVE